MCRKPLPSEDGPVNAAGPNRSGVKPVDQHKLGCVFFVSSIVERAERVGNKSAKSGENSLAAAKHLIQLSSKELLVSVRLALQHRQPSAKKWK